MLRSPFGDQSIEAGRTFRCRAPCIVKELRAHFHLPLAVSFSRVEQRRKRGTIQVVEDLDDTPLPCLGRFGQFGHKLRNPSDELQFDLVDVKLLMVQLVPHGHSFLFRGRGRGRG